jgi:ATP/maltotriose-dependent transcriptional regulator MalT
MHASLSGDTDRRTVVLHGLGGVGKTQLALAYAKQYHESYSAVFWLNIKDEDSLKQSFARISRQVLQEHPSAKYLSNVGTKDADDIVNAVKRWLGQRSNRRWLLIYDNYDNPKLQGSSAAGTVNIRQYLPESYQGSVIVTTRSPRVDIGHSLRIGKLENVDDCLEIISTTSRIQHLQEGMIYGLSSYAYD